MDHIAEEQTSDQSDAVAADSAEGVGAAGAEHDAQPPAKCPRLLSRYKAVKAQKKNTSSSQEPSTALQVTNYFDLIEHNDVDDAILFWSENKDRFPHMSTLAVKVLSVPASSAPVERIFSTGGIIMRPHRSRLGHTMLSSLVFLKCNYPLLW